MADATILSQYLVLKDLFPGTINENPTTPIDGYAGTSHHNVAAAAYTVGTKHRVYIPALKGYSTLMYMKNGTASGVAIAAGQAMIVDDVTGNAGYISNYITNDPDEGLLIGPVAIALSAITNAYYGWFWVGGCCPLGHGDMTALITTATDDSITAGCAFQASDLTADKAGIKIQVAGSVIAGWSIKADG
jgi:hypothetical protein